MVLGDSIAWGAADTPSNGGWRQDLKALFVTAGWDVDFVGRQQNGYTQDAQHEAALGWFCNLGTDAFLDAAIAANPPSLIIIACGHNDANSQSQAGADILLEVDAMLDHLDANYPNINVIVSEVLDNAAFTSALRTRIQDFNSGLAATLSPHPRASACLTSAVNPARDDDVHPTSAGHAALAAVFFECVTGAAP